jgi:hypothetical protein
LGCPLWANSGHAAVYRNCVMLGAGGFDAIVTVPAMGQRFEIKSPYF